MIVDKNIFEVEEERKALVSVLNDEDSGGNHKKAFERLNQLADQTRNPDVQISLGICYSNGIGVPKDEREAVKWYRKAAEQGDADAQWRLGVCYDDGIGVPKNEREAVKWYRKAAEQGDAFAQCRLGFCYANSRGVPKDEREAVKWYRKAVEQGNAFAQRFLGFCYANGSGVPKDEREAVKWYRKAAEQGDAAAQYSLGVCYEDGIGVPEDESEAVKWYRKAAKQGDADAQERLDIYYEDKEDFDKEDAMRSANVYGENADEGDINNVRDKLGGMKRGPIAAIWDKVMALWDAFWSQNTPTWLKGTIIGGLIYLVSPIDLIPDVIPFLGLTDDASVIVVIFNQLAKICGTIAISSAVIKISEITMATLRGFMNSLNEKIKIKIKKLEIESILSACYENGDFENVHVGLYDEEDTLLDKKVLEGKVNDEIYEGLVVVL